MQTPTESDRQVNAWLRQELARGSRWQQPAPAAARESSAQAQARADFRARKRAPLLVRLWRWMAW